MTLSISSSSSGPLKIPRIESQSEFQSRDLLFIPDASGHRITWFKDLNAFLGMDAINLSRVCRQAEKMQNIFRYTDRFRAILSSPDFHRGLSQLNPRMITFLNQENRRARQESSNSQFEKTARKLGECVERTLVRIFRQPDLFPNYDYMTHNYSLEASNELKRRNKNPLMEAIQFLSRLHPIIRNRVKTLDFSKLVAIDNFPYAAPFAQILELCPFVSDFTLHSDFTLILNDVDLLFRNLNPQSLERLNLNSLTTSYLSEGVFCELLTNVQKLKVLHLASYLLNEQFLQVLPKELETLSLNWGLELPDPEEYETFEIAENTCKIVNEDLLAQGLQKSRSTLQKLQIIKANITGRFLYEAQLFTLRALDLSKCPTVTDEPLVSFVLKAKHLSHINLSDTGVSGSFLKSIRSPVKTLELKNCPIEERYLKEFLATEYAQSLESLDVRNKEYTIVGAFENLPTLPKLTNIEIEDDAFENEEQIDTILRQCPNLNAETIDVLERARQFCRQNQT